ncbi:MAG: YncE family protein, partial [Leptolyngbyaceae cyanobacterium CAN_BIN12]|nr:YncE family protein [Leptolyngbyaceae cyanobacterium CAN_BIN12]
MGWLLQSVYLRLSWPVWSVDGKMTQANVLELAQSGDADAIALLMNASLQAIGVSARAVFRGGNLYVLLESERTLAPSPAIEFIRRGIARLGLGWLSSAVVYSRLTGQNSPVWVQEVRFGTSEVIANPLAIASNIDAKIGSKEPIQWRVSPFMLSMLVTLPLVFLPSSVIWFRYLAVDQTESIAASPIPPPSIKASSEPISDALDKAFSRANQAYFIGKTAQSRQDWQKAATHWKAAIALLKTVPKSDVQGAIAQQKLVEYQQQLGYVIKDRLTSQGLVLVKTITGDISPKSIVHSGKGLFFAQNMMYRHSVTVYDRQFKLVKTISDQVKLADSGYTRYPGTQQGSPVEAAFSPDGQTAWVSNYEMYGDGFSGTADDVCSPEQNHAQSFLYRISANTLNIDRAVQVGAVPKYVATTPNNRYVLASNWCSWDVSVIDPAQNKEVRRIPLGPYPRGIAIADNQIAYVAIMGSSDVAAINLTDFSVNWLRDIGNAPRHLNLDPAGRYLYATLNGEGQVAKIDLATQAVVAKVATGSA